MAAFCGRAMLALVVFLGLSLGAMATQYTVGGKAGWTYQTTNGDYNSQFANQKLFPGDTLLFPFTAPVHNVYEVPVSQIASCDFSNPIAKYTQSNAVITLNSVGEHAFGCEIPTHCSNSFMALTVTVSAAAPVPAPVTPPATPPTPAPVTPPTPAPVTPPTPAPKASPVKAPAPAPKAPAKAPVKAPAPAPKAKSPTTVTPASETAPAPGPSGPPAGDGSMVKSGPAMVVGAVFAGVAALLL